MRYSLETDRETDRETDSGVLVIGFRLYLKKHVYISIRAVKSKSISSGGCPNLTYFHVRLNTAVKL